MQAVIGMLKDIWATLRDQIFSRVGGSQVAAEGLMESGIRPLNTTPALTALKSSLPALAPEESRSGKLPVDPQSSVSTVAYVGIREAFFCVEPVMMFDGVMKKLFFGQPVLVEEVRGRWASCRVGAETGWVLRDNLFDQPQSVYPEFIPGKIYDSEHKDTIKLRLCIRDAFNGAAVTSALQDVELVTYLLSLEHRYLPWSTRRPRPAGSWHDLLAGLAGIRIGLLPHTGSVMEYREAEADLVALVKAVTPNNALRLVGVKPWGEYYERTLSQAKWQEFAPIFIDVT